jgi:uncharacterized protein with HEPN domain
MKSKVWRSSSTGCPSNNIKQAIFTAGAIERAAQIVSEAAKAPPADLLARHGDAPWKSIVGIGNILRHEYQRLEDRQLWEIATIHPPALEPVVRRMIQELDI